MTLLTSLSERKIARKAVAAALGVSEPLVSQWCTEKLRIPAERAMEIHKRFGISLYEMRPDLWTPEMAA